MMFKSTKEVLTALQQIRSLLMGLNERVEQSNRILSELVVALTPKAQEWTELPDYPKRPTIFVP